MPDFFNKFSSFSRLGKQNSVFEENHFGQDCQN